ncbi:MAG: flavin reductase [Catalinimonas sp.]
MRIRTFSADDLTKLDRNYRRELINSLPGYRSATLIGTADADAQTNLAMFNSVVHVGANPPLLGFMLRPLTVPRHTFDNIKEVGYYTFNTVRTQFYERAHQTSAKFEPGASEFDACDLTPHFSGTHPAPYVAESPVKIGLKFVEQHLVKANDTILMVGEVVEVIVAEELLEADGYVAHERAEGVSVVGLDAYYQPQKRLSRLPYARPQNHSNDA